MNTRTLPTSWAAVVAAVFLFININLFAIEEQTLSYSLSTSVASKYLSPGMGVNLNDNPVVQSSITASWKNFTALVWASHDLNSKFGDSFGDEIDYGLLWADSGFSAGVIYFDEPNTTLTGMGFGANDIVYGYAGYTHNWNSVELHVITWENYTVPFGGIYSGGNVVSTGIGKTFKLSNTVSFHFKTELSYGDGGFGTAPGFFSRSFGDFIWSPHKSLDIKFGGKLYIPMISDYRETDGLVRLEATYKF